MICKGIRKIHEGKFITRYDVDYITSQGNPKTYEIISRNHNIQTIDAWNLFSNTENSAKLMCDDGIHPNEDGYKLLSKLWIERLPQLKREF